MARLLATAALTATAVVLAHPAFAHTGAGAVHGYGAGFLHPLTGLDHQLTMVAVGLWGAQRGGKFLWALPAAFVSVMAVGAGIGMAGVPLPLIEEGILLSVVGLGTAVGLNTRLPMWMSLAGVALFAICHGYAHGAEMPEGARGFQYLTGFATATVLLQTIGVGAGLALARLKAVRWLGWGIASAGVALALGG